MSCVLFSLFAGHAGLETLTLGGHFFENVPPLLSFPLFCSLPQRSVNLFTHTWARRVPGECVQQCPIGDIGGRNSGAHIPGGVSITMDEDGTGDGVEDQDRNSSVDRYFSSSNADGNDNNSGTGSSTASTPPRTTSAVQPSNTNQTDIEMLRAENALLRLALAEAQEKLRAATNNVSGRSVRPVRSRSPSDVGSRSGKDAGTGGVACVQMRRLLLKDDRFLRENFLPFLNMNDFGRCVVCGSYDASQ